MRAKIALRSNDPWLKMHNRVMHQHWKANVDFQLIFDRHAAVAYMVKYASKGEQSAWSLQNICRSVMQNAQDSDNLFSKLRSLMIRCIERRDVGGGESSRMIFRGKHCQSSFNFVRQSLKVSTQQLRIGKTTGEVIIANNLLSPFAKHAQIQS